MGREEEIAYAREHGIPVKGGTEAPPYSIDDNLWGRSSEGGAIEDLDAAAAPTTSSSSSPGPRRRPTSRRSSTVGFERGVPGLARRRAARAGRAARARGRDRRAATGSGSSTTSRTGSSGSRCATSTRCRRRRSSSPPTASSRSSSARSTRTTSSPRSTASGPTSCYAGLWHEPLRARPRRLHGLGQRAASPARSTLKLYKGSATRGRARSSPYALYDRVAGRLRRVGRRVLPAGEPGLHRAVLAADAGWRIGSGSESVKFRP